MASSFAASTLFSVHGVVAVITGGGSGLGLYAAKALDANGAKAVYIVGRRESVLKEAASQAVNGTIIPIVGDSTNEDSLKKIAEQVQKEHGYINLLYANAGVSGVRAKQLVAPAKPTAVEIGRAVLETSIDDFTSVYKTNCAAVLYTVATFLDLLDAGNTSGLARSSQIIICGSVGGLSRLLTSSYSYMTSKAAVIHMSKMLATNLAHLRIRCNVIAPGYYPSEMTGDFLNSRGTQIGAGPFTGATILPKEHTPEERTGSEQDYAGAILFLASQAGAYINGMTLVTDGGRLSLVPSVY